MNINEGLERTVAVVVYVAALILTVATFIFLIELYVLNDDFPSSVIFIWGLSSLVGWVILLVGINRARAMTLRITLIPLAFAPFFLSAFWAGHSYREEMPFESLNALFFEKLLLILLLYIVYLLLVLAVRYIFNGFK